MQLDRKQLVLVILVTLSWGLNWPMMKMGVTGYPPLTFRALCLWTGLPVLWLALRWLNVPFYVARKDWRELFWLAVTNMIIWHVLIILAVSMLSSGRAAILGYTMSVFSALLGVAFFGARMRLVQWLVEDWGATVDLRAPDNCTPLWTACFNGKRDVVSYLLRVGADDTIVGTPPGEPAQSPALAARRNRNPGIADFVDFEAELRRGDPSRRPRQVARQMTKEEFRESMRSSPQFAAMDGGAA
jgi:hypothetical protein